MQQVELPDFTGLSFDIGDGLVLRRFQPSDAEGVFETVRNNVDHLEFMHWITPDYSLVMAREFIERSTNAARDKKSLSLGLFAGSRFIGSIGFTGFEINARRTEIGYWIDKAYEGRGIVMEACTRLIDYAFDQLGMNRVEIRCSAENARSAAIPERLGFKQEARLRQQEYRMGKLHDFLVFGLLRSEWDPRRTPQGDAE